MATPAYIRFETEIGRDAFGRPIRRFYSFRGNEIRDEKTLDLYDSPAGLVAAITTFEVDHSDCSLDFDCTEDYGSPTHIFTISGWRKATAEELAIKKRGAVERDAGIRAQEEAELERAREVLRKAGEL